MMMLSSPTMHVQFLVFLYTHFSKANHTIEDFFSPFQIEACPKKLLMLRPFFMWLCVYVL